VEAARAEAWSGVRRVLAWYAGGDPRNLAFSRDARGKPHLVGRPGMAFSLSHAEGLAALAVSCGGSVGIDLEALRTFDDAGRLARRFLSPAEHETVARTNAGDRDRVFLQTWTRKEAVLKALGLGLTWDTRRPQVGAGPATTRVEAGLPGGAAAGVRSASVSPRWLLAAAWVGLDDEPGLRAFDASTLRGRATPG
jgi:4'-phosphopantetheinyl transferase